MTDALQAKMKAALDELAPSSSQSVATNCPTGKKWSNSDTHTCQELADYYGCDDIVRGCLSHGQYNTKWKTAAGGRGRCFGNDITPQKGRFMGCKNKKEWCWAVGDPHYRTFESTGAKYYDYHSNSACAGCADKLMLQYGAYKVFTYNYKWRNRNVASVRGLEVKFLDQSVGKFWCPDTTKPFNQCRWSNLNDKHVFQEDINSSNQQRICSGGCRPGGAQVALGFKKVKDLFVTLRMNGRCVNSWCQGGWIDMGIKFNGDWRKLRTDKGLCISQGKSQDTQSTTLTCPKLDNCCSKYKIPTETKGVYDTHLEDWCMKDASNLCCNPDGSNNGVFFAELTPDKQTWNDCCDIFEQHCGVHGDAQCGDDETCDTHSGQCV